MLKTWYNFGKNKEKGFTLIELLIVVAIIAILAAIAIPQFSAYRKRGYNAAANSDLRNIRTTAEAIMADFSDYGSSQLAATAVAGSAGVEVGPGSATLYLVGGKSTSSPVSTNLSPNVYGAVKANINTQDSANTAYTAVTTHTAGDLYFGADSDSTIVYRGKKTTAALTYTAGYVLGAQNNAVVLAVDDFATKTCPTCAEKWVSIQ